MGLSGCKKDGSGSSRKASERLKWVQKPASGSADGNVIKIPGLGVSFETPEVLYVYKECAEAAHSPEGDEGWIPVIKCNSTYGGGDELSEERSDVVLTIFAGEKKTIINERGVAILKQEYIQKGYKVDEIIYIEDYQGKTGRRGIQSQLHLMDAEGKYPEREIQRFRFPVGDIVFVAQVDYPYGDDRSGIDSDWQRILWNFQLDEDGSLYPDAEE
jgi:hypothetical protein